MGNKTALTLTCDYTLPPSYHLSSITREGFGPSTRWRVWVCKVEKNEVTGNQQGYFYGKGTHPNASVALEQAYNESKARADMYERTGKGRLPPSHEASLEAAKEPPRTAWEEKLEDLF
jgi:hypothetical protein